MQNQKTTGQNGENSCSSCYKQQSAPKIDKEKYPVIHIWKWTSAGRDSIEKEIPMAIKHVEKKKPNLTTREMQIQTYPIGETPRSDHHPANRLRGSKRSPTWPHGEQFDRLSESYT